MSDVPVEDGLSNVASTGLFVDGARNSVNQLLNRFCMAKEWFEDSASEGKEAGKLCAFGDSTIVASLSCGAYKEIGFFEDFDPFSLPPESSFCPLPLKADNLITLLFDPRTNGARTLEKLFLFISFR